MDTATKRTLLRGIYGVPEIDSRFKSQIHELFYQQTRAVTLRTLGVENEN